MSYPITITINFLKTMNMVFKKALKIGLKEKNVGLDQRLKYDSYYWS